MKDVQKNISFTSSYITMSVKIARKKVFRKRNTYNKNNF